MNKFITKSLLYLKHNKWLLVYVIVLLLILPLTVIIARQQDNRSGFAAVIPLAVDVQTGKNQTSPANTIASPSFTTRAGNELVVVFLASDGTLNTPQSFASVSAGTLQFTLAKRANSQKGTAEVWYAYSAERLRKVQVVAARQTGTFQGMIRVVTFTGAKNVLGATVNGSGVTGAPSITLTTTGDKSMILGVGNDPTKAITHTVDQNQRITQQFLASKIKQTFWAQQQNNVASSAGTVVKLDNLQPTTDAWNMVGVEVLALEQATSPTVPNLVAAYALNESGGTFASDASGHGLTGELRGGPVWTSGKYANALAFDGTDDYVELGNPASLDSTGSLTISAWINSTVFPNDDAVVVSKLTNDEKGYQLDTTIDRGSRTIGFKLANTSGGLMIRYGKTPLSLNTWDHIAGVYNAAASTIDVYLNGQLDNGELVGTVTPLQQPSPLSVNLGRRPSGGFGFIGKLDEIRLYDRALTQTEIESDMNTGLSSTANTILPTTIILPTQPIQTVTPTLIPIPTATGGGGVSACPAFPAIPDENCTGWRHLVGKTVSYTDGSSKVFNGLHSCTTSEATAEAYYISQDGLTFEDCYFSKGLVINAANITIRRSQIHGIVSAHWSSNYNYNNLTMTDVEIEQEGVADAGAAAAGGAHYNCIRCNVHHTGSGLHGGDYTLIQDSYIHDLNYTDGAHGAGIGMGQGHGSNSSLIHNNIQCNRLAGQPGTCSSALSIYAESKIVNGQTIYPHDILIKNNLFNTTGAYCVHATDSEGQNIKFIDNLFGKKFTPQCAGYGPVRSFYYPHDPVDGDPKRPACANPRPTSPKCAYGDEWTGNMWQDGSGPVKTGTELTP